ncbi:diaminopimelate epimerase [bacterium]|nr:diaminopimelate epimerase [bacterium]
MKLYKMNGAGNAFVILDARGEALNLSAEQIRRIAHPTDGAGADQVIAIEHSIRGDAFMRIWNADGGEVAACGNGARAVGWLLARDGGPPVKRIETLAGVLKSELVGADRVSVDMGSPLLKWEEIPLAERMDTRGIDLKIGPIDAPYLHSPGCVNMGNPHVVFFVPDVSTIDVAAVGSLVEWHPMFPQGVNVGFAEVKSASHIRLRVWERGAGLTRACGTGACASVVAAHRRKLTDRIVRVTTDGGDLDIEWRGSDDRVIMTGPVELEFESRLGGPLRRPKPHA